jgi:hypothetical protein
MNRSLLTTVALAKVVGVGWSPIVPTSAPDHPDTRHKAAWSGAGVGMVGTKGDGRDSLCLWFSLELFLKAR